MTTKPESIEESHFAPEDALNSKPIGTPRKVCFLIPNHWDAEMGGAEYQAKIIIETLAGYKRHDFEYLARKVGATVEHEHLKVHKIGNSKGEGMMFDGPGILRALHEIGPDTIYTRVGCAYVGIAAYYCKKTGCKLVWHIANDDDVKGFTPNLSRSVLVRYFDKKLLEYGIRHADVIIAQTKDQARLLRNNYGISATRVIPNFHPKPNEDARKSDRPVVIWLANLKKLKQPEKFVDLANELRNLDADFLMIGEMQFSNRFRKRFLRKVQTTPNLSYLGRLSQAEVNQRLADSHILVNTSTHEGFSNTFIQAWMRQVPVVSLNVNPDKILEEEKIGFCANGDVQLLARQVQQLLENLELRENMGQRAQLYAFEHHSTSNGKLFLEIL